MEISDTSEIGWITGEDSLNRTAERWNVYATDLGHTFRHDGDIYMVFGDTFGPGGRGGEDWRSNTMARLSSATPPTFADMITGPDGDAKELIGGASVDGEEVTVIPTYGFSDGSRMYLHYMAVAEWGAPGHWELTHSGIAYSGDDGHSWTVASDTTWPGDSNFGQVAIVQHDGYVYLFGIPAGRFGAVAIARTDRDPLKKEAYEYWNGRSWIEADPSATTSVVPPPVGELSVRWSPRFDRWLMMYLNERRRAIVLRTAPRLTGPWDGERIVVTAEEHPQLYAPYLFPRQKGSKIRFTMSRYDRYNVLCMEMTLRRS